jgi:hypothetical protein
MEKRMGNRINCSLMMMSVVVGLGAVSAPALAQSPPDYGYDWVTVGAPGNIAYEGPPEAVYVNGRGAVDHRYRIMKTKIANRDWLEFSNAYRPYFNGQDIIQFESRWGYWDSDAGEYRTPDFARNWGAEVGWEYAARYANWLHNGKVNEQWAFENGAYDTSTFTRNDDGTFNHQQTRNPDARFWLPSLDEYLKAAYYDPDKNGIGGWWTRPNGTDNDLLMALPEDGGETYGELGRLNGDDWHTGGWDLEQYPETQTPWGMLDVSATTREWTESPFFRNSRRYAVGSSANDPSYADYDQIWGALGNAVFSIHGFRLASTVPAPGTGAALILVSIISTQRRKRR